jgi:hypothetical protein
MAGIIKFVSNNLNNRRARRGLGLALVFMLGLSLFGTGLTGTVWAASLTATNSPQVAGQTVTFSGEGFAPNEGLGAWATGPDGQVNGLIDGKADSSGHVSYSFSTLGYVTGQWYLTLHGLSSKQEAVAPFQLVSGIVPGPTPPPPPGAQIVGTTLTFNVDGFQAGESINTWTTDPNGFALAQPGTTADSAGKATYSLSTLGYMTGHWNLTFHGQTSKHDVIKSFDLVTNIPPEPGASTPTPAPSTDVPQGGLTVSPNTGYSGQTFQVTGSGYAPREQISLWDVSPLGQVNKIDLLLYSDLNGNVSYSYAKSSTTAGIWAITLHGLTSGVEKTGFLRLLTQVSDVASVTLSPDHGAAGTVFTANGKNFFNNEPYSYYLSAPDNSVYAGKTATTNGDGTLSFTFGFPSAQPGRWAITVTGITSRRQVVVYFNYDS